MSFPDQIPVDPYRSIRYKNAFDQTALYEKYKPLITRLHFSENLFPAGSLGSRRIELIDEEYANLDLLDSENNEQELKTFEAACLGNLNRARRSALGEPARNAAIEISLMSGAAFASMRWLGSGSMGGSFAGFAAIFDSLRLIRPALRSIENLISWPNNPLEKLEDYFAQNKCYIPCALWPKITDAFMAARQNEFDREKHTNFLEFALGFTVYKPKPPLVGCAEGMSLELVTQELCSRIDHFFVNYEVQEPISIEQLKLNVVKFVYAVSNQSNAGPELPRYMYLQGPGGIGKTHFVQTLSQWIEELLPGSVHFEDLVITEGRELEGTDQQPGAILRVLRNQLIENKHGSILMLDEAIWLNDPAMTASAKRTFNGDRSKFSTAYFGHGIDGTGVKLELPPLLVFVASNELLQDDALASRFDVVQYPTPKQTYLIAQAKDFADRSTILRRRKIRPKAGVIAEWVASLPEKSKNFRTVQAGVEVLLIQEQKERRRSP